MDTFKLEESIGLRIKQKREDKGISRKKLSELVEVSPAFITYLEQAKKDPSFKTFRRLCFYLNCSADYLLFGITKQ